MSHWLLGYIGYDPATEGVREALCTLGNGYFATRGCAPEADADGVHYPGTYIAGCYDRLTSTVAGQLTSNEDLVNVPNWLPLTFRINDGPWFTTDGETRVPSYSQELDLRRGVLTRLAQVVDTTGRVTRVTQRRIVSMADPHLAALETTIVPENWSGRLEIRSALDARVTNAGVARYRDLSGAHLNPVTEGGDEDVIWVLATTATSHVSLAIAARTRTVHTAKRRTSTEAGWAAHHLFIDAVQGESITVEKVAAVYTCRDRAIDEPCTAARRAVARADGFDALLERHSLAWSALWHRCGLSVSESDAQRVLNLHIFHILQTVSEHVVDLDVGVPARGLHGEAYRGHVFWDELFVLPFLSLRFPEIARSLLMYRWRRLPEARWAARAVGRRGAMFPWQSASDGREETPALHLNPRSGRWLPDHSRLQLHVGLAIAHNVWRFYEATGDVEFLAEYGAEILLEVARFFADLADYNRTLDRYEIRGVVGPDEYHDRYLDRDEPGIDNNSYTNVMAVWVLRRALDVLAVLPEDRRQELRERLALGCREITRFEDVSRKMRVIFQEQVISQFEGYERLAEFDWAGYRDRYGDIRRLDRILEAEGDTPNRYRVSKQADVLMLFYLLSAEELADILTRLGYAYEPGLIPRTIGYYLARTSHGSTLSTLVHAWVLARSGAENSWGFFVETLLSDVSDIQHGTTAEGIHLGAMAGTVDLVQRCYGGVATQGSILRLNPRLPGQISELRMELRYRGHWGIVVTCRHDRMRVELRPGVASPIDVAIADGESVRVEPGGSWETALHEGRAIRNRDGPKDPHRQDL